MQALYFPLKLVFFLPGDPGLIAHLFIALVYLLSGFGMLRLLRVLGASEAAATLAALVWTASGALASESFLTNWVIARTFVPWTLAEFVLIARAETRRAAAWPLLRAFLLGSQALWAGEPQTFMLQGALAFAVMTAECKGPARERLLRALVWTGAIHVAAFLFTGVQWYPALDLAAQTPRGAQGVTLAMAHECTTHPVRYLELLFPLFFGTPTEPGTLWARDLFCAPGTMNFYIPSFHIGLVALVLSGFAAAAAVRRERRLLVWVVAAAAFFLMSLGERGLLFDLVWGYAPYWNHFRWPERLVPWLTLALAVLAGLGLDRAAENPKRSGWILAGAGLLVVLLTLPEGFWTGWGGRFSPLARQPLERAVTESLLSARRLSLLAAVAGLALGFWKHRSQALWIVAGSAGIAVLSNASHLVSFVPGTATVRTPPRAAEIVKQIVPERTYPPRVLSLPVFRGVPPQANHLPEYGTTAVWHLLFANVPLTTGVDSHRGYNSFLSDRWIGLVDGEVPVLNQAKIFAAEAVVAGSYDPDLLNYGADGYPVIPDFFVVPLKDPVPRAVCPGSWKGSSPEATANAVRDVSFDPRRELLMEPVPGRAEPPSGSRAAAATRCEITSYGDGRVVIEVDQTDPAPVALLDAYFSGWTATVNGNPAPIYPAWGFARAVPLPAGRSAVEFRYRVPGFRTGLLFTAAAALLVAGGMLFLLGQGRESSSAGS